jgi:twinkle protein
MQTIEPALDLSDYLEDRTEGVNVRPASYFCDQVKHFFNGGGREEGAFLPWAKTHENIRIRAGEVSLWHGENFSGKTTMTSQVCAYMAAHGERILLISLEMTPKKTLAKLVRQSLNLNQPDDESIEIWHDWSDDRIWLYDRRGSVEWTTVLAVIRYAKDKFGITQVFVDNLMKCVRGEDDYNGQKDFVNGLCAVAQDLDLHVHLVHHTRKPAHGSGVPSRYDAKGSGSISDQVDNVFGVWRNRDERKQDQDPDCVVNCDKQRNGEWDGKFALWFDLRSLRYTDERSLISKPYVAGYAA